MANLSFTQLQTDLLIGTLLGDGSLATENYQTWRYRAIHKAVQSPYIFHKYEILKEFCATPPVYSQVFDERTNKYYERYSFNTLTSDKFRFFGQLFYKKENDKIRKHVPSNIKNFLTPKVLAYWYMDDGAMKWKGHSNAVRLCTDSFSDSDVNILKTALEENFKLKTSLQKKNDILRICILEESYQTLHDLIVPSLLPSMYYKFPDGNYGVYNGEDIGNDLHNRFLPRDL